MASTANVYIAIDRTKLLSQEPHIGHNRWQPDIPPAATVERGSVDEYEERPTRGFFFGTRPEPFELQSAFSSPRKAGCSNVLYQTFILPHGINIIRIIRIARLFSHELCIDDYITAF